MTDACLMDTLQPDTKQYNLSFHAMDNYANWCRWNTWCNVKSHVFTFEWYSNYQQIQSLAFDQHEIATETISLQQGLQDKGYEEWVGEMIGMREILRHFANVSTNDVVGMRAPYLKPGRNAQYQVGFALQFSSLIAYLCRFCVCVYCMCRMHNHKLLVSLYNVHCTFKFYHTYINGFRMNCTDTDTATATVHMCSLKILPLQLFR